ncbi:MAG: heme-binding domain-containing protein [Chloroflexales bacterium]|nr:heme-binding domain-containing protein [Chloroflexales bacterium]
MFTLRRFMVGFIVLVALIQFIPVQHSNPKAADPVVFADPNAAAIAKRSCYDCHSNQTTWPWYSYVAPFSWYTINHVEEGRARLNFSDMAATLAQPRRERGGEDGEQTTVAELAENSAETINKNEMPPAYYTLIHKDAILSAADKEALIAGINQALASH